MHWDNPITADYIKKNLPKKSPKLILTPALEKTIRQKLKDDPYVRDYYQYLVKEAGEILSKPVVERELEGFRLLFVSREMLRRMSTLCMVYRIGKDPKILEKIDQELRAVIAFQDWNPDHFLDVSEMSFAVALATDWVGQDLPKTTLTAAKKAIIEKGIMPSYSDKNLRMGWVEGNNNWNSVCHGGLVAASLAIADIDPELAAKTISRALEKMPNSVREYGPDGVYPEGPSYWWYGTSYAVIASSVLTSALGTDFGISKSPGFLESGKFRLIATAPSGTFFNYSDASDTRDGQGSVLLSWFAAQTGDPLLFEEDFFAHPEKAGPQAGLGLPYLTLYRSRVGGLSKSELPSSWHGKGINPIAVFRGTAGDPGHFYLATKGGRAQLSHGNMDAGSFIFELNGVRWVLDPGNQRYYLLNKIGFNLSGYCQDCERWTLLTKGNQGHSTIVVNDERFDVAGTANIVDFKTGTQPEVTYDMSKPLAGQVKSLKRRFVKESDHSVLVEDTFETSETTKYLTWALMTTAEVIPTENGAILKQDGQELKLSILAPAKLNVSIVSLDPPPLEIDKTIPNLKRVEVRVPAYLAKGSQGKIQVRLSDR
ncbi:heparinase II/III family protein [Persicitalea sp.]|uniref:heparinase II/III domain-containing protein n=1 Tax=Persicitalea sp. TaxID=3100273 RepID=UPI0035944989